MARFTVYLPDQLAERGRAANLNFSGLLRRSVIERLKQKPDDDDDQADDEG